MGKETAIKKNEKKNMCLDSVKKPEMFLKKLITEAGHVLKMCLFYAKSEPRCAY